MDEDKLTKITELIEEVAEDNATAISSLNDIKNSQNQMRSDFIRQLDNLREDFQSNLVYQSLKDICRELVMPLNVIEQMIEVSDFSDTEVIRGHVSSLAITLQSVLARMGVEKISITPGKEIFDQTKHFCVNVVEPTNSPFPDAAPQTIVRVLEDGYILADRVLSPARVEIQTSQKINHSE